MPDGREHPAQFALADGFPTIPFEDADDATHNLNLQREEFFRADAESLRATVARHQFLIRENRAPFLSHEKKSRRGIVSSGFLQQQRVNIFKPEKRESGECVDAPPHPARRRET